MNAIGIRRLEYTVKRPASKVAIALVKSITQGALYYGLSFLSYGPHCIPSLVNDVKTIATGTDLFETNSDMVVSKDNKFVKYVVDDVFGEKLPWIDLLSNACFFLGPHMAIAGLIMKATTGLGVLSATTFSLLESVSVNKSQLSSLSSDFTDTSVASGLMPFPKLKDKIYDHHTKNAEIWSSMKGFKATDSFLQESNEVVSCSTEVFYRISQRHDDYYDEMLKKQRENEKNVFKKFMYMLADRL